MEHKINVYEYSGIVCPGAIFLLGMMLLFPQSGIYMLSFDLGDLGVFIILSFCVGHITQSFSNILENVADKTNFYFYKNNITSRAFKEKKITKKFREVYSAVSKNKRTERIDVFNKQYGLMRGLFSASLLFLIIALFYGFIWKFYAFLLVVIFLCLYRAIHFSYLYSEELAMEYISLKQGEK